MEMDLKPKLEIRKGIHCTRVSSQCAWWVSLGDFSEPTNWGFLYTLLGVPCFQLIWINSLLGRDFGFEIANNSTSMGC
ncbi:hypothetical protein VNO77_22162 [Canavalia gladiata]|uniref:Uncharacterized protein n=1 Tax=Canavalia gladiata TaxID=3824 RepID=A0AAN9L330_CANGL